MKKVAIILSFFLLAFSVRAQENVGIRFVNDNQQVYHLSLIMYTPDGKIQTRVSNLNPAEIKAYSLPVNTEIFIADAKQEAFAMQGNDIKSTRAKPFLVLKASDANIVIPVSSIPNSQMSPR
jgi:hypothetical protein